MRVLPSLGPVGGQALEEGLVARPLARVRVVERRVEPAGGAGGAGVVVLHLVVVPDVDHREAGMDAAAGSGRSGRRRTWPGTGPASRPCPTGSSRTPPSGPHGVVVLGVDVVAEADHEVEVLLRHERVRVEVPEREVLAGEEGEAHRLVRVGRERGAEAADGALPRRGSRSGSSSPRRAAGRPRAPSRSGRSSVVRLDEVAGHDLAEAAVAGHLELDGAGALGVGHPRPERDRSAGRGRPTPRPRRTCRRAGWAACAPSRPWPRGPGARPPSGRSPL